MFSWDRPNGGAVPFRAIFQLISRKPKKKFKHSPQSNFRADNFFDFKYFKSFFNFNLRFKNVQIIFSIHVNFSNSNRTEYLFPLVFQAMDAHEFLRKN